MTDLLQTTYDFLEIIIAFGVVVLIGYSFLCMFFFLKTEDDEARGFKKKSLSWFNYRLGKGFLAFYCILGTLGIIRAVLIDVGLSFFGVAILVTIMALVLYVLKVVRG